jgi:hypothetical protein
MDVQGILAIAWFVMIAVFIGGASISMQQARYFDGESNAHWSTSEFPLFHTPKHPHAVRAKRRGWVLLALGASSIAAGLIYKAMGRL